MTVNMMNEKTLLVIGGGAAGFFCAVNATRAHGNLKVILIEKSSHVLSKVKVSGGGRCNVTHACFNIPDLVKFYPRGGAFLKKAFHQFNTNDTVEWFQDRSVPLKTEADGRIFPASNTSQSIINCLLNEASLYGIDMRLNADVVSVEYNSSPDNDKERFLITLRNQKKITANYLCIASGGFPKQSQYDWIVKLGHSIENPVPSLFTFNIPDNKITSLMGITVQHVVVKIAGTKLQQNGPLLITHWGLSGPAILKLSAWGARELANRKYEFDIIVNWLPDFNEQTLKDKFQLLRFEIAAQKIFNRNPFGLPARLWEYLLIQCDMKEEIRWADLPAKEQNKLIKLLCAHPFSVKGKTTFKEEFVTAGGVQLTEIDPNTMMSRLVPGLFFAGEIIDIDGVTGGFNFQNAWTTGWIAANHLKEDFTE